MLVQIVPIFVGFTLLGVMIFGAYFPRFGSFSWYAPPPKPQHPELFLSD